MTCPRGMLVVHGYDEVRWAAWRCSYSIDASVTQANAISIAMKAIRMRRCMIRSVAAPFDFHAIQRASCASRVSTTSTAMGIAICRVVMTHHS